MALAIVRLREEEPDGHHVLDAEIGANRWLRWTVGRGRRTVNGVPMLGAVHRRSALLGPLEPGLRGRAVLRVPGDVLDAENHHLQLLSYRDEQLRGPAASDIVELPRGWHPPGAVTYSLPPLPASGRLSHAQFLDALTGVVSQLLPAVRQVLPMIGSLFGGAGGRPPAPSAPAPAATGPAAPDLVAVLQALLAQLEKTRAPGPARAASLPAPGPRYSYASWVQLLAALPALSGLLEKVATPETVKAVLDSADPTKMVKTVISGLTDAAKIGQEATDKLHAHLAELNPGLGDDLATLLLTGLATESSVRPPGYRLSRQVTVRIADLAPTDLTGYPQVAFAHGTEIRLPVVVDAPRPVPAPALLVTVRDAASRRRIASRSRSLTAAGPGRLPAPVVLPVGVTARLVPGREYEIRVELTWRGRDGLLGAGITQLVRIVGPATFDAMVPDGPAVRLDDVARDRSWWHRVWSADLDDRTRRLEVDVTYHYRVAATGSVNRRVAARARLARDGRALRGSIESGLVVAPPELARLATRLGAEPIGQAEMAALSGEAFVGAFARVARSRVAVRGRHGTRVAIWVWPEVTPHRATFLHPNGTSELTGQVLGFVPVTAVLPVPSIGHVVAARTP